MVGTATRTARSGSAAPPARSPMLRPTPRHAPPAPSATARSSRAVYEALEQRCLFVSSLPTTDEQLMIELINRARANPAQYAQDFFLEVPLTDASPRPPVAANGFLTSSARKHAAEMAINDYFGSVSPLTGKGPNQMVRDEGYPLSSQFPTTPGLNNVESITAGPGLHGPRPGVELLLEDIDPNTGFPRNPPGNRIHLLAMSQAFAAHDEIGVGHFYRLDSTYEHYWSVQTAFDDAPGKFVTGVAFNDRNVPDEFYSLNEGMPNVTVEARNTAGQVFSTTTWASGGYSLRLQPGTYTVTGSGGGLPQPIVYQNVVIGTDNVKLDFLPTVDDVAPTATLLANTLVDANRLPFGFSVRYADAGGIAGNTLGNTDLRVTGPNNYNLTATFLEASGGGIGLADPLLADYSIPAPGGSWDYTDNGTYTVSIQFNEVRDLTHNPVPAGVLGILTVNVTIPGDANRDGRVNGTDFSILASNFGQTQRVWATGDFTGDGVVNGSDFSILASNFGKSVPGAALTAAAVPAAPTAVATPAPAESPAAASPRESTDGAATTPGPTAPVQAAPVAARRTVRPAAPRQPATPAAAAPRRVVRAAAPKARPRPAGAAPAL